MRKYTYELFTNVEGGGPMEEELRCLEKGTVAGIRLVFDKPAEVHDVLIEVPETRLVDCLVPMMADAGVPLFARRNTSKPLESMKNENYMITQIMCECGFSSMIFQEIEHILFETILFRKDNVPFTLLDYHILQGFVIHTFRTQNPPFHITKHLWTKWVCDQGKTSMPTVPDGCDKTSYFLEHATMELQMMQAVSCSMKTLNYDHIRLFYSSGLEFPKPSLMPSPATGTVHGVKVCGMDVLPVEVPFSDTYCNDSTILPIASLCKLPIRARLDDSSKTKMHSTYRISRLMRDFTTRRVIEDNRIIWIAGSSQGVAPAYIFRTDGAPFTVFDMFVLQEFEALMFDRIKNDKMDILPTRDDWLKWSKEMVRFHDVKGVSVEDSWLLTEAKFPPYKQVIFRGLINHPNLNGMKGKIIEKPFQPPGGVSVNVELFPGCSYSRVDMVNIKLKNIYIRP